MKHWLVLHDFGSEGWKIQAECDDIYAAVVAREDDIRNGGGTVIIVECVETMDAYQRAHFHRLTAPTS